MNIEAKVSAWTKEGLITSEQGEGIVAFEARQPSRNWVVFGTAGVGVLAVAVGLVSIIAANWSDIPSSVKLIVYFLIQAGLGFGFIRVSGRQTSVARETLLTLSSLTALGGIGLISQVYNLHGEPWEALALWCAITLPAAVIARSRLLPHLWTVLAIIALVLWAEVDAWIFFDTGMVLLALGFLREKFVPDSLGKAFTTWGVLLLFPVMTVLANLDWVSSVHGLLSRAPVPSWGFVFAPIVALFFGTPTTEPRIRNAWIVCLSLLTVYCTTGIFLEGSDFIAALFFVAIWACAAVIAAMRRRRRIFDIVTAVIGLRFVVAYFEVFGSLAMTGIGLIITGGVILGAVYAWNRYRRSFEWMGGNAA